MTTRPARPESKGNETMISPVTVIGGAGRTGRLVVETLLSRGVEVRVASRRATTSAADLLARGVAAFHVDVRTGVGLDQALLGAAGVVYSVEPGTSDSGPDRPETTLFLGVRNALGTCRLDLARFVLISSIYVTRPDHPFNQWGHLLDWRLRGEEAVRASGLPYTIVRPSWLTDQPGGMAGVRFEQGDRGDGEVTRGDVAQACVQALDSATAAGVTFEMYNEPGSTPTRWDRMFAALAKDHAPAR